MVRGEPRPVLTTAQAAVLGSPVDHSLSPVLHAAAYQALGLPGWTYGRHEVDEGGLAPFVAGLDDGWVGLSLTMPLKVVALDVADEVDVLAREAGAANTLTRTASGCWRPPTSRGSPTARVSAAQVPAPGRSRRTRPATARSCSTRWPAAT